MQNTSVKRSIKIRASPSIIWNVLTDPHKIILYTGAVTKTDWQKGSLITWSGQINGKNYQHKGQVLRNVPYNFLAFSYWSGLGGDADLSENYSEIAYILYSLEDNLTELTYSRIKIPTVMEKQIFEKHLPFLLEEIKRLSEKDTIQYQQ